MATILPPLALSFHRRVTINFSPSKNKKSQKQKHQNKNSKTSLSFPKSYPTPLLTAQKSYPRTKLEVLDAVVKELEASAKNHLDIELETFASLLETCYELRAIDHGSRIHRLIPRNILKRNEGLSSKLLRLYASCGCVEDAHQVFDEMRKRKNTSAFAWNSLISGYTELCQYEDALALYFQMEEEGFEPDRFTFPRVFKACGGIGSIQIGMAVHRHVVRLGFADDGFILNALVDMYGKCGDIVKARRVFDQISSRDSVSWNSILTSYIHHGLFLQALDIFRRMIQKGYRPDSVAASAILSRVTSLKLGVQIHGWAVRQEVGWNLSIANSLIVLYAKHGELDRARQVFDQMSERDVVSWNSIISAHSKDPRALIYFEQMENAGALSDNITFVSLLSTCAHLGLVDEGKKIFTIMTNKYRIKPIMEHYSCMVNLYGRAGLIQEAYNMIVERMEFEAGPTVWGALLYACYLHKDVGLGEVAAEILFELEPDNERNFELLMKIYANADRLEDVERVRKMIVDRGLDI
ncbi:pentatricopeptide repeat-containing protein At4g25270, chloroplastic-like [Humulus lupulus]|uniref:pentatricopeptide repeat-containing protein At4g25270, chloroplastic-like n=1 Tax=Humulus lupulus TaxID=3486 RepID=UPI002B408E27|nr:pentatricopeptide repeat-containing protein At4g25270, chloroplastic-like [Humulus lupulus]